VQDVNRLVKQFDETRKVMKMMTGGKNAVRALSNMPQFRGKP
jgi:signal recognition particle subunit SRP54